MDFVKDWTNEAGVYFEREIVIGGFTYLVIFGYHINGGWICVPNHGWGCEATDCEYEINFNADKLVSVGAERDVAEQIASHISSWLKQNQEYVTKIRIEAQNRMMERIRTRN